MRRRSSTNFKRSSGPCTPASSLLCPCLHPLPMQGPAPVCTSSSHGAGLKEEGSSPGYQTPNKLLSQESSHNISVPCPYEMGPWGETPSQHGPRARGTPLQTPLQPAQLSRCTTPPQLSRQRDSTWRCALGQRNAGVVCTPSTAHGPRAAALHSCGSAKPHWVAAPCSLLSTHSVLRTGLLPSHGPTEEWHTTGSWQHPEHPNKCQTTRRRSLVLARTVALASHTVHWHSLHVDCVGSAPS